MGRLLGFLKGPSGHGDHNDGRGVVIARVVLDDQHRADAALLMAGYRVQVGVVDLAAVEIVKITFHMDTSFF